MGKIKRKKYFFHCGQSHNVLHSLMFRECGYYKDQKKNAEELASIAERNLVLKTFKEQKCDLPGKPKATFLMVFSPDGTKVASTHGNHNVYITELASGKNIKTLSGHCRTPWCIAFYPSSSEILATGCLGGQVRVWDLNGACAVWNEGSQIGIASLAFHPSKKLLVIATNNKIYFWDWSQPKPCAIASTASDQEKVRYVAFDNLGTKLITGIANIKVWEPSDDRSNLRRVQRYRSNRHRLVVNMIPRPHLWNHGSTYGTRMPDNYAERTTRNLNYPNEGTSNRNDPVEDEGNEPRMNDAIPSLVGEGPNRTDGTNPNFQSRGGDEPPRREPSPTPLSNTSTEESSSSNDDEPSVPSRHSNILDFTPSSLRRSSFYSLTIPLDVPQPPVVATHEISRETSTQNPSAPSAALLRSESSRTMRNTSEHETLARGGATQAEFPRTYDDAYSVEPANISPDSAANAVAENVYWLLAEHNNLDFHPEHPSTTAIENPRQWSNRWVQFNPFNRTVERSNNIFADPTRGIYDLLVTLLFSGTGSTTTNLQPSLTNNTLEEQEKRANETQYFDSTAHTFNNRRQLASTQQTLRCLKAEVEQLMQIRRTWDRLKTRNLCKQWAIGRSADRNSNGNPEPSTSSQHTFSSRAKLPLVDNGQVNRVELYPPPNSRCRDTVLEYLNCRNTIPKKGGDDRNRPSTSRGLTTTSTTSTGSSTPSRDPLAPNNHQDSDGVSDDKCLHSLLMLLRDDGQLEKFVSNYLLKIVDALCPRCCHRRSGENGECPAASTTNDHTYSNVTSFSPVTERVEDTTLSGDSNNENETDATATDSQSFAPETFQNFQFEKINIAVIMRFTILANCMEHWNNNNVSRDERESGRGECENARDSSSNGTVIHGTTALRAGRALCVIGQSLMHLFDANPVASYPELTDLLLYMRHLLQLALDLTDLLVKQAQNEVRKLHNRVSVLMNAILPLVSSNRTRARYRNTNRSSSCIFSFNPFETLSYRVQAWNFTDYYVPDITDPTRNLIVKECKIHNDASINISADGKLLTAVFPPEISDGARSRTKVGVYSLDWKTLGKKICSTQMADTVVSVSLSPLQQHLLVGLAKIYARKQYVMARIYKLKEKDFEDENLEQQPCLADPAVESEENETNAREKTDLFDTESEEESDEDSDEESDEESDALGFQDGETSKVQSKDLKMIPIRLLYPSEFDDTGAVSLNCIRWAPQPGQGIISWRETWIQCPSISEFLPPRRTIQPEPIPFMQAS